MGVEVLDNEFDNEDVNEDVLVIGVGHGVWHRLIATDRTGEIRADSSLSSQRES